MQKTPLSLTKPAQAEPLVVTALSLTDLASYADRWLLDCEIRQHSAQACGDMFTIRQLAASGQKDAGVNRPMHLPARPASEAPLALRGQKPEKYLPKPRLIRLWHRYLVLTEGEYPLLKTLSARSGIAPSTAFDLCRKQHLLLSQSRPRKVRPE